MKFEQLSRYVHLNGMDEERLVKRIINAKTTGKRRKGSPRKKWNQQIEETRGKTVTELKELA